MAKILIEHPSTLRLETEFDMRVSQRAHEDQKIIISDENGRELVRVLSNGQIIIDDGGEFRVLFAYDRKQE